MDLRDLATQKAQERGLDPNFVHKVIGLESSWDPLSVGTSGERGLMQIMPRTARSLGVPFDKLFDPIVNIDAGTKLLSQLQKQFGNNPGLLIPAYNAGPGTVQRLMSAHGNSAAAIYPYLPAVTKKYLQNTGYAPAGVSSSSDLSTHRSPISLAHLRGYVKPGLQSFYTKLNQDEESDFQDALRNNFFEGIPLPEILNPQADYDYRGYFQAFRNGDPRTEKVVNENDHRLHYDDNWKTPYHVSFSKDSQYASENAPAWHENYRLVDPRTGEVVYRDPVAMSAHEDYQPDTAPSLIPSPPEGFLEKLYNTGFSKLNAGLPPAKSWVGPDLGLPEPPSITTGKLASLGLLGLGGMGGPIAEAVPAALATSPMQFLRGLAASSAGSTVGGKVGEIAGGDVGRDVGEGIGSVVGMPLPKFKMPKSDVVAIPPVGDLEGTAVLNRQGLAKPVYHGTPASFKDLQVEKGKNPEQLLFGPGLYHTTAAQNVAEGYAGAGKLKADKAISLLERKAADAEKRVKVNEFAFRQSLPQGDREYFDFLKSEINKPAEENLKSGKYTEQHIRDLAGRIASSDKYGPEVSRNASRYLSNLSALSNATGKLDLAQEKLNLAYNQAAAPNIRPSYLNIKKPFDIDKNLPVQDVQRIAGELDKLKLDDPDDMAEIRRFAEDLRFDSRAGHRLVHPDEMSEINGERLYRSLENVLTKKRYVNRLLEKSGFDGITHLGGGRFTGGPLAPMRHRVYIAFRNDQVIPYFNPKLSDLQTKRAKEAEFEKLISQYKKENKKLNDPLNLGKLEKIKKIHTDALDDVDHLITSGDPLLQQFAQAVRDAEPGSPLIENPDHYRNMIIHLTNPKDFQSPRITAEAIDQYLNPAQQAQWRGIQDHTIEP